MDARLIYPMAAYVFYIWFLALLNFRTRVGAWKAGQVDPKYFKALQGSAPEKVINVGRHFDNQFQAPMIFFMTCLVYLVLDKSNDLTIAFAWIFILTRLVHSFIHLGKNRLLPRVYSFAAGWLVILAMWIQLLYLVRL